MARGDRIFTGARLATLDPRLPGLGVVEDGAVLGMISIGDLVKAVIEDQQQEIAQLQQYIAS